MKSSGLLAFCDKFSIPVVTLTNTCGFAVSPEEEEKALPSVAAAADHLFFKQRVPKINIITGKAYGSAYLSRTPANRCGSCICLERRGYFRN